VSNERQITPLEGVILIQFTPGTVVSSELFKDIFSEFSADAEKYHHVNHVWDLRYITPSLKMGFEDMIRLVQHLKSRWDSQWKIEKTALVVASKAAFGLSRMFVTLAEDNLDYEVKVFENDLEAALDWARADA